MTDWLVIYIKAGSLSSDASYSTVLGPNLNEAA
jgi:hypothetical protein